MFKCDALKCVENSRSGGVNKKITYGKYSEIFNSEKTAF